MSSSNDESTGDGVRLTVLVIAYNEAPTVEQAMRDAISIDIESKEIIVVDNCSTDGTAEKLRQFESHPDVRVIYQPKNYDVGRSFEIGIAQAKGKYIYVHHTDLEYDHTQCRLMCDLADEHGYDVILGSRIKDRLRTTSRWQLVRERPAYIATVVATYLANRWYDRQLTDIIGLYFYRTSSVRNIPIDTYGGGFAYEFTSRLLKAGLKVGEINIGYNARTVDEGKKVRPYHMIPAMWSMFRIRFLDR